jgi:dethiobiotin synthetase
MNQWVVAGIGTGVGKTLVSAILSEALEADYWKPVQAGSLDDTDTDKLRMLVSNSKSFFHPEAYRLTKGMSPHAAATQDGVSIQLKELNFPNTANQMIVELAGGIMVPLNDRELNVDLLKKWDAPVVLVSQNYLGSINHTLLTVGMLKNQDIPIMGIIFNGEPNGASEDFITRYTGIPCLAKIPMEDSIDKMMVKKYATQIKRIVTGIKT